MDGENALQMMSRYSDPNKNKSFKKFSLVKNISQI